MDKKLPSFFQLSSEVAQAIANQLPVVALESTVVTHGLPYPDNVKLAQDMENEVRQHSAVPATIAVLDGKIQVGVQAGQIERLAQDPDVHKVSSREFAPAVAHHWNGGTTVAGTLVAASLAGIRVFATGGIGGVHRQAPEAQPAGSYDISADLPQLARSPVVVVCAGAKAILDLPATLEYLETAGVPVVGYQTDEFPAFYARSSGLPTSARADTPEEVVQMARAHWELGLGSAILVVVPPPQEVALPASHVEEVVAQAIQEAYDKGVRGQAVTPFLLQRVSELTGGASLQANLGLLRNNAGVAAAIAVRMFARKRLV